MTSLFSSKQKKSDDNSNERKTTKEDVYAITFAPEEKQVKTEAPKQLIDGDLSVSIYSPNGDTYIQDVRKVKVQDKTVFADVPNTINPTSVQFKSLSDPKAKPLEQNVINDTRDLTTLYQKFLNKRVVIIEGTRKESRKIEGELIDIITEANLNIRKLVVKEKNTLHVVQTVESISSEEEPTGLSKPTLQVTLLSDAPEHLVELNYEAPKSFEVVPKYNAILSHDDTQLDFNALITLNNLTEKTFPNAEVKLFFEVREVGSPSYDDVSTSLFSFKSRSNSNVSKIKKKSYNKNYYSSNSNTQIYKYQFPRKVTLEKKATKQLVYASASLPVKKYNLLSCVSADFDNDKNIPSIHANQFVTGTFYAKTVIAFKNDIANDLGLYLPAGSLSVQRRDEEGTGTERVLATHFPHSEPSENVLIELSTLNSVFCSKNQTSFNYDDSRKTMTESIDLWVSNTGIFPVKVNIEDNFTRWHTWKVVQSNAEHKIDDENSKIQWSNVLLNPKSKYKISYSVQYTDIQNTHLL